MEEVMSVMKTTKVWTEEVYQELKQQAQQKGIHFPDAELMKILSQIMEESLQIYSEVMKEIVIPCFKLMNHILQCPTVSYIKEVFYWIWSGITHTQETYTIKIQEIISTWMQEFKDIINPIIKGKLWDYLYHEIIHMIIIVRSYLDNSYKNNMRC